MLSGDSRTGKTTVINEVYKMLTGKYYSEDRHKDFEVVITHLGLSVAIKSDGDFSTITTKAMQEYHAKGCNVLICAHNIGKKKPLKEIKKHDHVLIRKTEPYRSDISCVADAEAIVKSIL